MEKHKFSKSLEFSHAQEDQDFWGTVYKRAIPGFIGMYSVRKDGWAQRGGIDRVVCTRSGRSYSIDEKVRKKDYEDILLERWSDLTRKSPGWIQQDLACDFIAYAFLPSKRCYLFSFPFLRRAWIERGSEWISAYPEIKAYNEENGRFWTTTSVAVPITVLLKAVQDVSIVNW